MLYSEKVKKSKEILKSINALRDNEDLIVTYGKDRSGNPMEYKIRAHKWGKDFSYAIYEKEMFGKGMNVERFTSTQMKTYTFDLMKNKTTYNFPLYLINVV